MQPQSRDRLAGLRHFGVSFEALVPATKFAALALASVLSRKPWLTPKRRTKSDAFLLRCRRRSLRS